MSSGVVVVVGSVRCEMLGELSVKWTELIFTFYRHPPWWYPAGGADGVVVVQLLLLLVMG